MQPITRTVDDFQFGTPARQFQVKVDRRLVWVVLAILAAAAVGFGYMTFVANSGTEIARTQATVVKQVSNAQDIQAQTDLKAALSAADTAFLDAGASFSQSKAAQLSILDQGDHYVDSPAPSTGPNVISVQAGQSTWSAAALAADGTCWWIARGPGPSTGGPSVSVTKYGHGAVGSACTGQAAAAANSDSW
jgi:hypothetical protein